MIVIRFGRWNHAAMAHFVYWRIYYKHKWTPFCRIEWRYRTGTKDVIFAAYENWIMGTWLGRFRLARWGSDKLYPILFK